VFHSCYLSAWVNSSTAKQQPVALGHFVLPPACLQEGEGQCPVPLLQEGDFLLLGAMPPPRG